MWQACRIGSLSTQAYGHLLHLPMLQKLHCSKQIKVNLNFLNPLASWVWKINSKVSWLDTTGWVLKPFMLLVGSVRSVRTNFPWSPRYWWWSPNPWVTARKHAPANNMQQLCCWNQWQSQGPPEGLPEACFLRPSNIFAVSKFPVLNTFCWKYIHDFCYLKLTFIWHIFLSF